MQLLAERIKPGDGRYKEGVLKSKDAASKETIVYAPAIILRKRDTRSYTSMYENIIEDIKNASDPQIPTLDDVVSDGDSNGIYSEMGKGLMDSDDTIYFPNKFNDEQVSIIEKARHNNKVLVQGPPGTGKSHTISNLICHLLANGKKVLVTAYTKRALEVLKDKLPEEFRNLTVNLLSGDSASIKDLEASVNAINDELSNTNIDTLKSEIESLEGELQRLKSERADSTNELLKIKEKSTRRIEVNQRYKGTLTEIASQLDLDKLNFDWYKDDYDKCDEFEIVERVKEYMYRYNDYSDVSIYERQLPCVGDLFDNEEYQEFVDVHGKVVEKDLLEIDYNLIEVNNFDKAKEVLRELLEIVKGIEQEGLRYKQEIIADALGNNKNRWFDKIEKSLQILNELRRVNFRDKDRNLEIEYPLNKSLIALKNDANILLEYMKEGNALSGFVFRLKKAFLPIEVKEKL